MTMAMDYDEGIAHSSPIGTRCLMKNYWLDIQGKNSDNIIYSSAPSITMTVDGVEMIRITKGAFYVEGRLVTDDEEVYAAFVKYIRKVDEYKA